jgi:DNA gyrase/topoisomerase IV subunit B
LNKDTEKVNPRKILKLDDASWAGKKPEMCYLFIAEGDSAKSAIISGRDSKTMGCLALRGKPLNTNSLDVKRLAENVEFFNILASMGLKIGQKVEPMPDGEWLTVGAKQRLVNMNDRIDGVGAVQVKLKELPQVQRHVQPTPDQLIAYKADTAVHRSPVGLRYHQLAITTDQDYDGHHIKGLLISNLYRFWPELFDLGIVKIFFTPLVKAWVKGKKEPIPFESEEAFDEWYADPANAASVKNTKYYKGLGSSTAADFKGYLSNIDENLANIVVENPVADKAVIDLVFGKEDGATDKRKVWLAISDEHVEEENV